MESVAAFIRVSIPAYFANLPVPDSFAGFNELTATDWLKLFAFAGGVSVTVFAVTRYVLSNSEGKVNPIIQKDSSKVVHSFDIEDLGDKAVYCRCWRSKKFPYCDGSHNKHNTCTGDNVGPLIIQKKSS